MPDSNSLLKVFEKANAASISLYLENENLKLKVLKGETVSTQFLEEVKKHKADIIQFLKHKEDALSLSDAVFAHPLTPYDRNKQVRIPLSFSQQRIWFIDQFEGSTHYHIPILKELIGEFDWEAFNYAWRLIVTRHETLRTIFRQVDGGVYQEVKPENDWKINYINVESWSIENIMSWASREVSKPFDLSQDYMLRVHVIKMGENHTGVVIVYHHIAVDGWSLPIIHKEFSTAYDAYKRGSTPGLPPIKLQYSDYAIWQRDYLKGELLEKKLKWWAEYLKDVSPLSMTLDYPRPTTQQTTGAYLPFSIDAQLTSQLKRLANDERASLFMVLLAIFKVLLYRYTQQRDICVGTPVANRAHTDTENIVGFFVNTLPIRSVLHGDQSFRTLLSNIKEHSLMAYQLQDVPIELIMERAVKQRDLSYRPLFQTLFVLQNGTLEESEKTKINGELETHHHFISPAKTKFDISLIITDTAAGLKLGIEYCADLFMAESIQRMAMHYGCLVKSILGDPNQPIDYLSMLTPIEKQQILGDFNPPENEHTSQQTVVDLFVSEASLHPTAVALQYKGTSMTYGQLDARSNQLAALLVAQGVTAGSLVGLSVEPSLNLGVSLLAILKCGGAYLPIDPAYPNERKKFMLADAGATHLISDNHGVFGLIDNSCFRFKSILYMDQVMERLNVYPSAKPAFSPRLDELAYVMYTSGSTGKPKGVMITHGSLKDYVLTFKQYFSINYTDKVIQQSSICFDTMVEEIYPALISGASVLLMPHGGKDIAALKTCIEQDGATILSTTPMVLDNLGKRLSNLGNLKCIISGGEMLYPAQIEPFFGKVRIVNSYGPTESTVCATYHDIKKIDDASVIGCPISNREVYILSPQLQLQPIGIKGEICIGGTGVSKGYIANDPLMNERFIDHPFKPEKKLYRTGDFGKYLNDGRIVFLGRGDDQVKWNGYRIELGEIENVLRTCEHVSNCAVRIWQGEKRKHLVAYIIPKSGYDKSALKTYLADKLPHHMLPSLWHELDELPVNANGKVDKTLLPTPDESAGVSEAPLQPRNAVENRLTTMWKELLAAESVSVRDNFFELGGHSLTVMELIFRIEEELSVKVPVRLVFEVGTIEHLSQFINHELTHHTVEAEFEPANHAS